MLASVPNSDDMLHADGGREEIALLSTLSPPHFSFPLHLKRRERKK